MRDEITEDNQVNQSQKGFGFTALTFGILALITWRWIQIGMVLAVMSVGFGAIAFRRELKWMPVLGILFGIIGIILSLTWAFLQWP